MAERQPDLVEVEQQSRVLPRDRQEAIRRVHELSDVLLQRVGRLRAGHALAAGPRARLPARLLVFQADRQIELAPRSRVHPQETLVHVEGDHVVERLAVVADQQHDHPESVVRHARDLGMEAVDVAAVIRQQVSAVRRREASHAVDGIEELAESSRLQKSIRKRDGRGQGRLQDARRDDRPFAGLAVVHQGDEPPRHVLEV